MIGAVIVSTVGIVCALLIYDSLKRPGDVSDPDAPFVSEEKPPRRGSVNWPTYGYDNAKTRYLPRRGIKPPYRRVWHYHPGSTLMEFSPVLAEGTIYGIDNDAVAFALDADTGKPKWRRRIGELNASSPTYHDGRLFFVNLEPGQAVALNAANGKLVWRRDLPDRSESSPVVQDDKVVFGCESGDLFAVAEKTGKVLWQRDVGGAVKGGPAISEGIVYAGDYNGTLSAVRLTDGTIKWQSSSQGRSLGRAGSIYGTPAVAFGRIYVGSLDGRMYSFVAETGKLAWSQSTGERVYAAPVVADTPTAPPSVYFGSIDGKVYALDAQSGKERWVKRAGGAVLGAGSVVGQIFYVANTSKRATAGFGTKDGKRVFGIGMGAYNPIISDGRRLYLTGYSGIAALKPRPATAQRPRAQKRKAVRAAERRAAAKRKQRRKQRRARRRARAKAGG